MIRFADVSKSYSDKRILTSCSWAIKPNRIIGLVGANGTGKTTLLRLLTGEETTDGGTIEMANDVRIGYLPQDVIDVRGDQNVIDFVVSGRPDLLNIEDQIAAMEASDAGKEIDTIQKIANLRDQYEMMGGYIFRSTAREVTAGMGFSAPEFNRELKTFSGGWRMRALLAQLLLAAPDYLLLDEPTNHLDDVSVAWLERFLTNYIGTIVLVSHDRYFLNTVVNTIAEMEFGRITEYTTNYDGYRAQKALNRERLSSMKTVQDKEIAQIERFIERFRFKNTKAAAVQSRVKKLEKLERVEIPENEQKSIRFRFPQPPRTPKVIAKFEHVEKRYDEVVVYSDLNFQIYRGDKIALVGPNGGGKTTLLKLITQKVKLDAGFFEIADNVKLAYFAQHAADALDGELTVEATVSQIAEIDESQKVRNVLGAFGFSGDVINKKISVLSGGEKNRVALAKLMFEKAALLLLDEPTNHLDIASRQVLEFALNDFDGAFIVVSHDRYFVNEVATRVVHIENGIADEFVGSYDDYLESLKSRNEQSTSNPTSRKNQRRIAAEERKRLLDSTKSERKELGDLETQISDLETAIAKEEAALADQEIYQDSDLAAKTARRYERYKSEYDTALERWAVLSEIIETIEADLP